MMNSSIRATIALTATLTVGVALGMGVERVRSEPEVIREDRSPRSGSRADRASRLPRSLEELGLSDTQRQQVRSVFEAYGPRTREIMSEMVPRMRALEDSARAEIDSILTEEQRVRFAETGRFWERRGRRGRGGSRGPQADSGRP